MNIQTKQVIDSSDWDDFVSKTYGRPYTFQQQDGCQGRGNCRLKVPSGADDYENDSVPEVVNDPEMGVSFKAWLERDPKQPLAGREEGWVLDLWWARNFYPNLQMVANDLHDRGLLPAGDYIINIDW